MKYFEVSKKFPLSKTKSQKELQQALLDRLTRSFKIKKLHEDKDGFTAHLITTGPSSIVGHAFMDVKAEVKKDKDAARIIMYGRARMAGSLLALYSFMFLVVLMIGLMPGSFETSAENSGAADVLVFMFVGIFIYFDLEKKIMQPKEYLEFALDSLETELG